MTAKKQRKRRVLNLVSRMFLLAAVAYAAHSFDDFGGVPELVPQAADMGIHRTGVAFKLIAPNRSEQFLARADASGVAQQILYEAEFRGRELDVLAEHRDLMGGGIDADPVAREHRIAFHHDLAPQDGADAEQQFPDVERLDHIVIRPQLEAEDAVHVFAPCRQHDDGDAHRAGVAFEFAADREPVHFRKHEVKQDEIRLAGAGQIQPFLAVRCLNGGVAFLFQIVGEQFTDVLFVLDDENGGGFADHG